MIWSAMAVTLGIGSDPAAAHMTDVNFALQRVGCEGNMPDRTGNQITVVSMFQARPSASSSSVRSP